MDLGRYPVLGVPISSVDYEAAVGRILRSARTSTQLTCSAIAVHALMVAANDPEHLYRLQHMDLLVPDGQPVRFALRLLHGVRLPDRVYGPELMLRVCRECEAQGVSVFLFGSTEEVVGQLELRLILKFPSLVIAGREASRFRTLTPDEAERLAARIRDSGAGITFVGLGCPRQEIWAYEFAPRLSTPVIAVGQAFDLNAGIRRYPPAWMQRWSLEWLYRLAREPARLWHRYLVLSPQFLWLLARERTGGKGIDGAVPPRTEVLPG